MSIEVYGPALVRAEQVHCHERRRASAHGRCRLLLLEVGDKGGEIHIVEDAAYSAIMVTVHDVTHADIAVQDTGDIVEPFVTCN